MSTQELQACISQGNFFFSQANYIEAIAFFKKASIINPNSYSAYFNWANCLKRTGAFDEAIQLYRRCTEIKPDLTQAYNNWGLCLYEQGLHAEANAKFLKAIAYNPRFHQAYNNSGLAFEGLGQHDEAISKYQTAVVLSPKYAEAYYNWGNSLLAQGRGEEATIQYLKAIETNPNYSQAYHNMGVVYSAQENYDQAIKMYTKAIELNPDYAEAFNNWGLSLYYGQKYSEAMTVFSNGIRVSAKEPANKLEIMRVLDGELTREENLLESNMNEVQKKEIHLRIQRIRQILELLMQERKSQDGMVQGQLQAQPQAQKPTSSSQKPSSPIKPTFPEPQLAEYHDFLLMELHRLLKASLVMQGDKLTDSSDSVLSLIALAATYLPPLSETPFDEKVFPVISRIAPDGILFGDVIIIRRINKAYQQISKILTTPEEVETAVRAIVLNLTYMRSQELIGEYGRSIVEKTNYKVAQAFMKGLIKLNRLTTKSQEYAFFDLSVIILMIFLEGIMVGSNVENVGSKERVEQFMKSVIFSMKDYIEVLQGMGMMTPIWCNLV